MSFRDRPLMTSVYEWHFSHACTLVMGRTLDLPSVIELAPCKYKRVYFYFGVQKKLITYYISTNDVYLVFFFCNCPVNSSKYYTHQRHTYVQYLCTNLISANCLFVYILFITFMYQNVFCNINHCNDAAPCWDLDWTIQSYLILSYLVIRSISLL